MKSYCTQNNGRCQTCSLANYGMDCANNPIKQVPSRKGTRHSRMMAAYDGHHGPVTIGAVLEHITPQDLRDRLTGTELGLVMSACNRAYHKGRADEQNEECIYIQDGDGGNLLPRAVLKQIKIEHTQRHIPRDPRQIESLGGPESFTENTYTYNLDAQEVF